MHRLEKSLRARQSLGRELSFGRVTHPPRLRHQPWKLKTYEFQTGNRKLSKTPILPAREHAAIV